MKDIAGEPGALSTIGRSRSTSAGSLDTTGDLDASANGGSSTGSPALEGASPLYIRNTFLEGPSARPSSLEGSFEERCVRSFPATREVSIEDVGMPPGLENIFDGLADSEPVEASKAGQVEVRRVERVDQAPMPCFDAGAPAFVQGCAFDAFPPPLSFDFGAWAPELLWRGGGYGDQALEDVFGAMDLGGPGLGLGVMLNLSEAFGETSWPGVGAAGAPGSSGMPSLGSAAHQAGQCKPCAFVYTKGCGNGLDCAFCHLCAPGEKKSRKKEKKRRTLYGVGHGVASRR